MFEALFGITLYKLQALLQPPVSQSARPTLERSNTEDMRPLRFQFGKIYPRIRKRSSSITASPLASPPLIPLQVQVQPSSQIADRTFPNEIFTLIFEYLDDYNLYVVCLISRCFNELALRVFFSRFHGADLSSQIFEIPSWKLLHLHLSFFVPRIQTLVCWFDPWALIDLRDLRHLVSRLTYIDHLELYFPRDLLGDLPFGSDRGQFISPYVPDPSVTEEMRLIREILYGVAGPDRPVFVITPHGDTFTCSPASILSWELETCQYCEAPHQYTEPVYDSEIAFLLHFFLCCSCCPMFAKQLFECKSERMPYDAMALLKDGSYAEVDTIRSLRSLSIYHTQSLSHPFTVISVNFATPELHTELDLGTHNHLSTEEWSALLPDLDLRGITRLYIGNTNISTEDVYLLLKRNPHISAIKFRGDLPPKIARSSTPCPSPSPLFLTNISARPSRIIDIFQSGHFFPSIREITLDGYGRSWYSLIYEALCSIAQHHIDHEITLTIYLGYHQKHQDCRFLEVEDGEDRIERQLYCATKILLSSLSEEVYAVRIPRWLALFPSLRELHLRYCHLKSSIKKDFLRRVQQCCPNVQSLSLDFGEARTIDSWLENPNF